MSKSKTTIIPISNQKGGVAKTTTAMNVGGCLARMGYKVLLVDWDPQGNLTKAFGYAKMKGLKTLYSALDNTNKTYFHVDKLNPYPIKHYPENLFLLANNYGLSQFEGDFSTIVVKNNILAKVLKTFEGGVDFILIDCQPSLSILTVNAYIAGNYLLIPMEAEDFSEDGLNQLLYVVDQINENKLNDLKMAGIFFAKHEANTVIAKSYVEHFQKDRADVPQFETTIRKNVALKECRQAPHRMDIFSYDKLIADESKRENISNGTEDYYNLTNELLFKLGIKKKMETSRREPKKEEVNGLVVSDGKGDLRSDFKKFLDQI